MKIIYLFFLSLGSVFSVDKIHLKKGDVLSMRVERIDDNYIHVTDNLNRLKIPVSIVNYIEYDKPKTLLVDDEPSLKGWQVSHFNDTNVFLWNSKTGELESVSKKDISDQTENLYSGFWGFLIGTMILTPDAETRTLFNSAVGFTLEFSHKVEYQLGILPIFYSMQIGYAKHEKPISSQGIYVLSLMPKMHVMYWRTEYFRAYFSYGIGTVFLRAFTASQSSAEITGALQLLHGFEIFLLPTTSLRTDFGYQVYTQNLALPWLGNWDVTIKAGYYFY